MSRALPLVAFGIAIGTAVTYLVVRELPVREFPVTVVSSLDLPAADDGSSSGEAAPQPRNLEDLLGGRLGAVERAGVYDLAARSDTPALRVLLQQVASMPRTEGRQFALEALLGRYAEIDPRGAVAAVQKLDLGTGLLAAAYGTWATTDPSSALDALRDIGDRAVAERIGLALLPVLGNDDLAVTRIAGAATSIDADGLRVEALAARAEADPAGALDEALALPQPFEAAALERVAAIWVRDDVEAALRRADDLPFGPRTQLRSALLRAWARNDPEAALAYLRDLDPPDQQQFLTSGGLQVFALIEPTTALEFARQLPGDVGRMAQTFALQRLAATDPLTALRHVERLPAGVERDQLMGAVAAGYARADPDAALAWAQSLQPPQANVLLNVLTAVANSDPERALDIALSMPANPGFNFGPPPTMIVARLLARTGDPSAIANRVLNVTDRVVREQTLPAVVSAWSARDPEAAVRWLLENSERVPPNSLLQAAEQLGRSDPTAAAGYTGQVASRLRAAWIRSVAAGYAQSDPQAAMRWVGQYQGQPGYEAAVGAIVQRAAQYEPAIAARLLETLGGAGPEQAGAVSTIAYTWARQSPRDAAQWAAELREVGWRRSAVSAVAQQWSASDPAAARGWALGLPRGDVRDIALAPVIANSAAHGETIDYALVDAFSADGPRQQALFQAVGMLAGRDPDAARRLASDYLNDPSLQAQVEQLIQRAQNSGAGVFNAAFPVSGGGLQSDVRIFGPATGVPPPPVRVR